MGSAGKIFEYGQGKYTTAKLYNFTVNKSDVKKEHKEWLIKKVAPLLKNGGSVSIVGLASRTGSDARNMTLSGERIRAVIDVLRKESPNNFKVAMELSLGERLAMLTGVKDGMEGQDWRGVAISAWDKPTPPPPPPPPPPKPQPVNPPPTDKKLYKRWLGIGVKSGGQLGIGGYESTTAYMLNLGDYETFDLQIAAGRWGLGLGGSGGAVAVLGFGFSVPYEMHRTTENDWGVNVAFTEKLITKGVLKTLETSKYLIDGFKNGVYVAPKMGKAFKAAGLLQNIRDGLHTVFAGLEMDKKKGFVVIDLPLVGVGLELSAFLTKGTVYVSNPSQWIGPDQ